MHFLVGGGGRGQMRNTDGLKFWSLGQSFEYHQQFIGEENSNPLQYSCLRNPMDRGAWWAIVHGVTESDKTEQLSIHTQTAIYRPFSNVHSSNTSDNSKMLSILIHPNFTRFILNYSLFLKVCSLVTASKNHNFVVFLSVMLFSMKCCTFILNPSSNPKRISYPKISALWIGDESGRLFWNPSWC